MLGQGADQRQIFLWRGGAKNGLGKLAIALVAARLNLDVEAAAAGLWVARRGHGLCIAGWVPRLKELAVPGAAAESPAKLSTGRMAVMHRPINIFTHAR